MAIRNNIVAKKTTELMVLFHKKKTKIVFIWPSMDQLCLKVLKNRLDDKLSKLNNKNQGFTFKMQLIII